MPFNVAYLDDEPGMCQIFIDNFSTDDIKIIAYTDPVAFLADAKGLALDLIVLDFRLPNTNGDEVAKALGDGVPKVIVSGDLHLMPKQSYLKQFTKPFNFDEFEIFLNALAAEKRAALKAP